MTGTDEKVVTLKDVKDDLNQILDRLSAIEVILNDPLHGIDFPENVKVDIGEQPTMAAGIENFDGNYTPESVYDMNMSAAVDTINVSTSPTVTSIELDSA